MQGDNKKIRLRESLFLEFSGFLEIVCTCKNDGCTETVNKALIAVVAGKNIYLVIIMVPGIEYIIKRLVFEQSTTKIAY